MQRLAFWGLYGLATLLAAAEAALGQRPPLVELLPQSTAAFVYVPNYSELRSQLLQTAPGRIVRDEQLAAFSENIVSSVLDFQFPASAAARRRGGQPGLAADWRDLPSGSFGEVVLALVPREHDEAAWLVLVDAQAHLGLVRSLLDAELARAERGGGQRSVESIGAGTLTVVARAADREPLACAAQREEVCAWCDDPAVLRLMLAAWDGRDKQTLAANPRYSRWRERQQSRLAAKSSDVAGSTRNERPDIEFFVDAASLPPRATKESGEYLAGQIAVGRAPYDLLVEAELFLDAPRHGAARLLALGNGDTNAERWVPREAATYATLHWNTSQSLAELARWRGQERLTDRDAGQFADLTGVELPLDASGIVPHLAGRFTHATWFTPSPDPTRAEIYSVHVRAAHELAPQLGRLVAQLGENVRQGAYQGHPYFEFSGGSRRGQAPPFPWCLCLLEQQLLLANQPAALHRAIDATRRSPEQLAEALDYKLVASKTRHLAGERPPSSAHFLRPAEFLEHFHRQFGDAAARAGFEEIAEQSPLHRVLLAAQAKIELPPLAAFERLLAPGGGLLTGDGESVRYTFFLLRRR